MKRSPLLILAITLFIDLLGFGLILPLLPVYITHYGGKAWVGGALLACFSLMQFIFSPIWGRVSDRRGRRPMILLSLCGSAISFLAFGLAPNLLVLFVARVAAGILSAASLPTAQAYIADVTPPEKRAGGMAVLGAAFGLGFALGPAIGGYVSKFSVFGSPPLATPSYVAASLCLLNFIWAFFMLPESHFPDQSANAGSADGGKSVLDVFPAIARALRSPAISAQLTVYAFTTFAFVAVESSFSWLIVLRFRDEIQRAAASAWQAGHAGQVFGALAPQLQQALVEKAQAAATSHMFLIVGLTMLVVQVAVIGGLSRRVGENRMVMFGSALLVLALVGIGLSHSLFFIGVLSACIATGSGVMNPSLNALITQSVGPQERGMISGAQQGIGSLARIIAPPINNSLVMFHTGVPFFASSILMSVAFLLSLRLKPLIQIESLMAAVEPVGEEDPLAHSPAAPVSRPTSELPQP